MSKPRGLFVGNAETIFSVYSPEAIAQLEQWLDLPPEPIRAKDLDPATHLSSLEYLLTTWGSPPVGGSISRPYAPP